MRSILLHGVSAAVVGLFLTQGALAFDPTGNATADDFLTRIETGGGKVISVGDVSEDGDQVSIEAIVLEGSKPEDGKMEIGIATLTGAEGKPEGVMGYDGLALEEVTLTSDKTVMTVAQMTATDVTIPAAADLSKSTGDSAPTYGTVEVEGVSIKEGADKNVTIESLYFATSAMEGKWPTAGEMQVTGLAIDPKQFEADGEKAFTNLGYEMLSFDLATNFTWSPTSGDLVIPQLDVTGTEMGKLSLAAKIGGLTGDVVNKLEAAKDSSEESLALLQGLTVTSLSVGFDNDTLVERVLDQQAKEAGADRATFVTQLKAGLPLMLTLLQNPEFQTSVSNALSSFLDKPGSLKVEAKPQAPVPFAQIMGTAMLAPQTLPQVLNVMVSANGQ